MPFKGDAIYGVNRTVDELDYPQNPPDVRIAQGGSYVAYLLINGLITERRRDQIEQVVRTLNARGESVMALIIRNDNVVLDNDAREIDFAAGIKAESVAPGVLKILIADDSILNRMIAPGAITADEIANGSVGPDKLDRAYVDDIIPLHDHTTALNTYNVTSSQYVTLASVSANYSPDIRPDALIHVTGSFIVSPSNTCYVYARIFQNGIQKDYMSIQLSAGEFNMINIPYTYKPNTAGFNTIDLKVMANATTTLSVRGVSLSGFMLAR